jgi:hypothetical protein
MKISKPILIIIAFVLVAGVLFVASRNKVDGPASPSSTGQTSKWESKTDEQASVTIVVKPVELSAGALEWKFDVGMNTHSVELDQDMTKIAVLVDDQGRQYQPVGWEGAAPGGHHREGILNFKSISPAPKSVELRILNIANVPVRSFSWQLQ